MEPRFIWDTSFPILVKNVRQGHIRVRPSWPNNQWFADCGEIDTGHWHHLCVTGNEESSSVFLDGELLFSSQHSAETTFTEVPFEWTVGASARSHTYQFKGAIDEVGIWNRALTEEEILALYNAPAPSTRLHRLECRQLRPKR